MNYSFKKCREFCGLINRWSKARRCQDVDVNFCKERNLFLLNFVHLVNRIMISTAHIAFTNKEIFFQRLSTVSFALQLIGRIFSVAWKFFSTQCWLQLKRKYAWVTLEIFFYYLKSRFSHIKGHESIERPN